MITATTYNNVATNAINTSTGNASVDVPLWIILPVIILFIVLISKDLN